MRSLEIFFYFFPIQRKGWLFSDLFEWLLPRLLVYVSVAILSATAFLIGAAIYTYVIPVSNSAPIRGSVFPTMGPTPDTQPVEPVQNLRDLVASSVNKKNITTKDLSAYLSGSLIVGSNYQPFGHVLSVEFTKEGTAKSFVVRKSDDSKFLIWSFFHSTTVELPAYSITWARGTKDDKIYGFLYNWDALDEVGKVKNKMWPSDLPHAVGSWPRRPGYVNPPLK